MKRDTVSLLRAPSRKRAFSGNSDRRFGLSRSRTMARVDEPVHLSHEGIASAEVRRIEHLNEYGCAPTFGGIGATMTRQSGGHRFDQQRERKTLVSGFETAEWQ